MPKKQAELKVVYLPSVWTPENQRAYEKGLRLINDLIDEIELRHKQAEQEKAEAS